MADEKVMTRDSRIELGEEIDGVLFGWLRSRLGTTDDRPMTEDDVRLVRSLHYALVERVLLDSAIQHAMHASIDRDGFLALAAARFDAVAPIYRDVVGEMSNG